MLRRALYPIVIGLLVLAAAGQVWLMARGPEHVQAAAIDVVQRKQALLAEQAAGRIGTHFEEVAHRLREARPQGTHEDMVAALARPWDGDAGILWFVHDDGGRVHALDARIAEGKRTRFMDHVHADRDDHDHGVDDICVCPMCLAKMHAVSQSRPLGDGMFLTANVDVQKAARVALAATFESEGGSAWLVDEGGDVLHGVGEHPEAVTLSDDMISGRARVPHLAAGWQVVVAVHRAGVTGKVRSGAQHLVLVGTLVLMLIVFALLVFSRRARQVDAELALSREHLQQAGKMEAIGRLAGGVAHDFNNLLTVIHTYAELLEHEGGQVAEDASTIKTAAERGADLTRQLLAFSRQEALAPRELQLDEVVEQACRMLGRMLGSDVALCLRLEAEPDAIWFDEGQLVQVLMNLVVNARDAMPAGGTIVIATRNVDGGYVQLEVRDDGSGMDAATQARIFEPFFTTKARDRGTGLGLATVHGIVTQSGGRIAVASELGEGTSFELWLPAA